MSNQDEKNESLESNFNLEEVEDNEEDLDSISGINKEDKIPIIYKKEKKSGKNNNNPRLSCQPILSYMKRNQSNSSIRKQKIRKKTTVEHNKMKNRMNSKYFSPVIQLKPNFLESGKTINYFNLNNNFEEGKNNNMKKESNHKLNYSNNNNKTKKRLQNNGYIKILSSKLNIYERAKKGIKRKENFIKKKKEQQNKEINDYLKVSMINKNSQDIMDKIDEYIPIQNRAAQLHNQHLFETILNEKKIVLKKKKEEQIEYNKIKNYKNKNKKSFNENDWDVFIKSQEFWNKEKQYKVKAAEIFRDNIELVNSIPEINIKSKKIIRNLRKKEVKNDVYTRLFNDFDNLQERKKMRMCNSMPSFKPLLNKSFKKSIFQTKKTPNKTMNNFDKKIDSYINNKLNNTKKININKYNQIKNTNKSFIKTTNNSGLKSSLSNFVFNSNILKKNYFLNNRKSRYDDNYFDDPTLCSNNFKGNKSQNISNKCKFYNKNNKKQKNNSYMNIQDCNVKQNFVVNKKKKFLYLYKNN